MQKGIDVVWCQVTDMSRAVAFYRDVLGFELVEESPYWSQFKVSESLGLGLHPTIEKANGPSGKRYGNWSITIAVDDLLACKAKLEAAGAKTHGFDEIEGYATLLEFQDLDDNPMQLAQHGATKASLGVE
ncbi:MAG: VOC family protein [Armatimonadota bacterium]|nr:VOC family protein [Armatimonadota bacterium]